MWAVEQGPVIIKQGGGAPLWTVFAAALFGAVIGAFSSYVVHRALERRQLRSSIMLQMLPAAFRAISHVNVGTPTREQVIERAWELAYAVMPLGIALSELRKRYAKLGDDLGAATTEFVVVVERLNSTLEQWDEARGTCYDALLATAAAMGYPLNLIPVEESG